MDTCGQCDKNFPGFSPKTNKAFLRFDMLTGEMQRIRIFYDLTDEPFAALKETYSLEGSSSSTILDCLNLRDQGNTILQNDGNHADNVKGSHDPPYKALPPTAQI